MSNAEITNNSPSSDIEQSRFVYGDAVVAYDIIRKRKAGTSKHSKVLIKVHPDQRVVATAPQDASEAAIHSAMLKQAHWIWQSLQEFAAQQEYVLSKHYVSGETCFYLGRRYLLKVTPSNDAIPGVKLTKGQLLVSLKPQQLEADNTSQHTKAKALTVKALLENWYNIKAKAIFHERLAALLPKTDWVKGIPTLRMQPMKNQWGSCSKQGNLLLNPHLIKAPKICIDYVILHELCHIAEHNHSARFWRLMTSVMPNWREVKAKLDEMGELYLNE